ncbi:MAG: copper amine oxidase N-terminal domain-containing protein [Megasphaera sp.]|jgi:hypothetical protein|nr:copper amine oxidase N-terminal domain-containing protein [Megasphaera sp.]MCI1247557.1 copper amine oxidase N-terminal domain-containing protein [Megasphaera sp.]
MARIKKWVIAICFVIIMAPVSMASACATEISGHIISTQLLTALPSYHIMINKQGLKTCCLTVPAYCCNGVLMLPLRRIAEQLGYAVTWDEEEQAALVDIDIAFMYFYPREDRYSRIGTVKGGHLDASYQYGAGPIIIEGKMYVPARVFEAFFNDVTVQDRNTYITSQRIPL